MCPNSPLEAYAAEICAAAKIVSAYCVENGLPHPSFDAQAPSVTLPSTAPSNVLRARQTIQTASLKIHQLATEPNEYLPYQAVHVSPPLFTAPYSLPQALCHNAARSH
jgi:6-hydroxytryprostatin B O-methyltransferase